MLFSILCFFCFLTEVLAEMGRLREFSNGRSEVVREELSDEIARLHTLYNYLIA